MNQNERKGNTVAVLGFIFSFIFSILGLILSIIGLRKSKQLNSGEGLSIAGIIISIIKLIFTGIIAIIAVVTIPSVLNTINNVKERNYCPNAYDCIKKEDGTYSCKYKDSDGNEKEINCSKESIISMNDKIEAFLTDSYVSTSSVVGSADPAGYYFDKNGNFAYHHGGYCIREENEPISYRGTWKLEDNELILTITEEEIAIDGTIDEDFINGKCIINYENKINQTNKVVKYEILEYVEEDIEHLELENGDNLYIIGASVDTLKDIANNGYQN